MTATTSATGVLAGAAGLAVGEVLGRVVPGGASPVLSIANRVVDLTPAAVRQPAIATFGSADKPLLVLGIALVAGLLAAYGARQPLPRAAALVAALSAVVLAAQLPEPGATPFGALVVAAALGLTAVGVLQFVRTAAPVDGEGRRRFLARSAAVGIGVVGAGGVLRHLSVRADVGAVRDALRLPSPVRPAPGDVAAAELGVPGLSPVITSNRDFYRIDTAFVVPQVDPRTWTLRVDGLVDRPLELTYADLLSMRQYEADVTLSCVSNEIGGSLVGTARWQGVLLRDVLERAGLRGTAEQVVGESVDGFTAGFPVEAAVDGRSSLVALAMNGEPLPVEHGFPARLVVPGLYGYVSATKWLSRIRLTTWDGFDGYWVPRGWSKEGPVKTMSRIDVPQRDLPDAGRTVVAGVAWAPGPRRGIASVEVRVDEGPWQRAELAPALSDETWRQWRWTWDAPPGVHVLEVRATDGRGDVQTGEVAQVAPTGPPATTGSRSGSASQAVRGAGSRRGRGTAQPVCLRGPVPAVLALPGKRLRGAPVPPRPDTRVTARVG
jgi:DMSO/TMAO reductase YedYZ molybdopterin-dependent catalytic subunit